MILTPEATTILLVVALVLLVVLAGMVWLLMVRLNKLRGAYAAATGDSPRESLFESVERQVEGTRALREDIQGLAEELERLHQRQTMAVSRVGVVRYDAFDDMGGALSFSVALLDEHDTGLLLSAINGRSETRCYAKSVVDGVSDHELSAEEREALTVAREARPDEVAVKTRRRRRPAAS